MLGERLTKLRKARKLTQQNLADKLHMSRGTYAQYEIDRRIPEYGTLEMMADFFEVSIDYLVGRTNDPNLVMSEEARVYVDDIELTNEEFMKKHSIKVDGIPLTAEEIRRFREYVRMERKMSSLDKGIPGSQPS